MHYTEPLYRSPYWPTLPLLEITQGCTHNKCKFCNMYRDVQFRMSPLEWVEEDLKEIAERWPKAQTLQILSANPLALTYDRLAPRIELIRNGVAGKSHSIQHAVNSAKIYSMCKPKVIGTGGLVLFDGTELKEEAERGEFDPCTERELMTELKTFIENLTIDFERFITHHTVSANLNCKDFQASKHEILEELQYAIDNTDLDELARIRAAKKRL